MNRQRILAWVPGSILGCRHPEAVAQAQPAPIHLDFILRIGLEKVQGIAAPDKRKSFQAI